MSPRARESRPGGHRAAEGLATTTRVPHTPATVTQTRVPALHEMTPAAQVIALAWYEIGHREVRGRRAGTTGAYPATPKRWRAVSPWGPRV